jgi:DNA repair protein RadC
MNIHEKLAAYSLSRGELLDMAREILMEDLQRGDSLTSPEKTRDYLRCTLGDCKREMFHVLFMDTRHRVIAGETLFQGTIDSASVWPRVVAQRALELNAAAVILAHNHPSGEPEPSRADRALTDKIRDALALLEIRLLDHFIVGDGAPLSMAERGMI